MNYASLSLQFDRGAPAGFRRGWSNRLGGETFGGIYAYVALGWFTLSLETA